MTRDAELWRQADAAFDRLLDVPLAEREATLATLGLPEDVLRVVRQLLAAHEASAGVLDRLPPADAATDAAPGFGALAGKRLGRWLLEREIGRGGMSVVYRAVTTDGSGQVAALKLLTLGALADRGIERFQQEQAVLARMRHAHIATLFESGVADDGTPWLAMALVDGERIDAWCEQRGLGVREIVTLFLGVCDAVSYAHRGLVIHRDLKPSNVLVDSEGHVRLLDFGIARLADEKEETTATQWRALTPGYAAPEQFAGAPPSTAMDVYGLGALLYRLLAGKPPREVGQDADTSPTEPSRTPQGSRAARVMRGDLDAIVMKALATDPARRHDSVAALAADLVAWLERRPVSARAPGAGYRMARFVARHKVGVAAVAAVIVAVVVGVAAALWQAERTAVAARRAEAEAARALAQARRAESIKDFLLSLFEASDPEQPGGGALDSRSMLKLGTERLRARSGIAADERIEVLITIGVAQRAMAWYDDAEAALAQAQALAAKATLTALQRATLHHELALLERARDRPDAALPWFEQAARDIADDKSAAADRLRVSLHTQHGIALNTLTRFDDAFAQFRLAEAALATAADVPDYARINLAGAWASASHAIGDYPTALAKWRESLEIQRSRPGNDDNASVALTLAHLATGSGQMGLLDDALRYNSEGLAIARAGYPPDHPNIADLMYAQGDTLRQAGRYAESLAMLDEASAMRARASAEASRSLVDLARIRTTLALGRWQDALVLVDVVRPVLAKHYGPTSPASVQLTTQEMVGRAQGDADGRNAAAFAAAAAQLASLGDDMRWHPLSQHLRCRLAGALHASAGDTVAAQRLLDEAASAPADALTNGTTKVLCAATRLRVLPPATMTGEDVAAMTKLLDEDVTVSTEAQGFGRATLVAIARRLGDAEAADAAMAGLAAFHAKRPVPAESASLLATTASGD